MAHFTGPHANLTEPINNPTWFPTEPEPDMVVQRRKTRVPVLYMCGRDGKLPVTGRSHTLSLSNLDFQRVFSSLTISHICCPKQLKFYIKVGNFYVTAK